MFYKTVFYKIWKIFFFVYTFYYLKVIFILFFYWNFFFSNLSNVRILKILPTRWQNRRMCAHLLGRELQHYSSLLSNRQQENVGSHQKYLPHIKGKRRSHSKMIGRGKITFRITPYPPETQRAQTKPCAHQRLSQTCL